MLHLLSIGIAFVRYVRISVLPQGMQLMADLGFANCNPLILPIRGNVVNFPVYCDKGTSPKKGGGSSFTVTKLPSSLEPKGQRPLSLPHSP